MSAPVGLCGFVIETSRVRGVIRAASASGSVAQPSLGLQVEDPDVRPDGARRLEIRRVVRAHHDDLVARFQQGRRDGEERPGGTDRRQHVVRAQRNRVRRDDATPVGGHQVAQRRKPAVVAVAEHEPPQVDLEVVEVGVGDRALGEVAGDRAVPDLLG